MNIEQFAKSANECLWDIVKTHFGAGLRLVKPEDTKFLRGRLCDPVSCRPFLSIYTENRSVETEYTIPNLAGELLQALEDQYEIGHGGVITLLESPMIFVMGTDPSSLKARLWLDFCDPHPLAEVA
jgi:hypothetical protein